MKKSMLALALASAFSLTSAYAEDASVTILTGSGTEALTQGKYQLGSDYTLTGTVANIAQGAEIDLNGHDLTITTSSDSGAAMTNVTFTGAGNLTLTQKGGGTLFSTGTSSLKADNITLSSANSYCLWSESTTKTKIATNNSATGLIDISSKNQTAIYLHGTQTSLDITDFAELHVTTTSDTDHGSAINNNGAKLNIQGGKVWLSSDKRTAFVSTIPNADHKSETSFDVDELYVSANIDLPENEGSLERKTAAFAVGSGTVSIKANVFTIDVTEGATNKQGAQALQVFQAVSDNAEKLPSLTIETKKTAISGDILAKVGKTAINSETLQVTGDVEIQAPASMPLTFSGSESFLTGAATIAQSSAENGDNTLSFKNNAEWKVEGESSVDKLVIENATIDMSGTGENVSVASLSGEDGTIVMDAAADNTLTATSSTIDSLVAVASKTADDVTAEEAAGMLDRITAAGAEITGEVKEGDYNGAILVNSDGTTVTKSNTLMEDVLTMNGATTLSLNRILSNDIRKRLGDVKAATGTTGAWARWDGGRLSGGAVENDFNTIQIGADTLVANQNYRVGVAASYTKGDADFTRGSADLDAWSLSAYGLWFNDDGMFADIIARVAKAETDITADGASKKGSLDNYAYSLSGEFGWRFNLSHQFYIEPQGELTWTYVDEDDLNLGTASYTFDSMNSLIGRAGFATGLKCPNNKGDVYLRVSAVHEFAGDAEIIGANGTSLKTDGKDTWVEYGIGANFNLTPSTYFWADVERTDGAALDEDWRATVGIRTVF